MTALHLFNAATILVVVWSAGFLVRFQIAEYRAERRRRGE